LATSIQWQIIRYAFKQFKSPDRRVLTKFIHEWLPLLDRHHTVRTSIDITCPSCWQATETVDHFLSCPHVKRTSVWKDLHEQLQKHQIKHTVSNVFHDLLAFGLYTARNASTTISFHHAPGDIQALFEQQACLGWRQLYYGRFSPLWVETMQQHHPQINSINYYSKCLTLIWEAVLKIWKIRNQHLHPSSYQQEDRTLLELEVQQIFQEAQQDFLLQDMLNAITPEQILSRNTRFVRQWVANSRHHIRAHQKAHQLQAKLHTQDIRTFFPRITRNPSSSTVDKNLLRPP